MTIFRERRTEEESEGEKNWSVASCTPPTRDLARNPGMCPNRELNWWLFGSQAGTQSTEPHQPGHFCQLQKERKEEMLLEVDSQDHNCVLLLGVSVHKKSDNRERGLNNLNENTRIYIHQMCAAYIKISIPLALIPHLLCIRDWGNK